RKCSPLNTAATDRKSAVVRSTSIRWQPFRVIGLLTVSFFIRVSISPNATGAALLSLSTAHGTAPPCPNKVIRFLLSPLKMVTQRVITKPSPTALPVSSPFLTEVRRSTVRWGWPWDRMAPSLSPTPKRAVSGGWYTPEKRITKRRAEVKRHGVSPPHPMFITHL